MSASSRSESHASPLSIHTSILLEKCLVNDGRNEHFLENISNLDTFRREQLDIEIEKEILDNSDRLSNQTREHFHVIFLKQNSKRRISACTPVIIVLNSL